MPDSTASQSSDDPKMPLMLGLIFTVAEMLLVKISSDEAKQPLPTEENIYQGTEVPTENHAPKKSMYSPASR